MKQRHDTGLISAAQKRKAQRGGFTIAEIALALVVFAMMTMMFAAVFPMAVRGAQYSSNYAQATLVAQHKMDQIRSMGYKTTTLPSDLVNLNIIDSTTQNADGSYNFTNADNLVSSGAVHGYFPAGSQGTVAITQYTGGSVPSGTIALVKVNVTWVGGGVSSGSYTLSTMIFEPS